MPERRRKKVRNLDEPRSGAAEKMWLQFAQAFNVTARRAKMPTIQIPGGVGELKEVFVGFVPEEEALRMKVRFFAKHIDGLHPLAEYGFDAARRQRENATRLRPSAKRDITKIIESLATAVRYEDWTSKELWDEFIGRSTSSLAINELPPRQSVLYLQWADGVTGDRGVLSFSTFKKKLSIARGGRKRFPSTG